MPWVAWCSVSCFSWGFFDNSNPFRIQLLVKATWRTRQRRGHSCTCHAAVQRHHSMLWVCPFKRTQLYIATKQLFKMVIAKEQIHASMSVLPQHTATLVGVQKWRFLGLGSRTTLTLQPIVQPDLDPFPTAQGAVPKTPDALCATYATCRDYAIVCLSIHKVHFYWSGEWKFTKTEIKPASRAVWWL